MRSPRDVALVLTAVWVGLGAGRPAAAAPEKETEWTERVAAVRRQAPAGFSIIESPPFVLVSDLRPKELRILADGRLRWAVNRLKEEHFARDPEPLAVWLFRDAKSYRKYTWSIFHERPSTPFGYYSREDQALIMNIGPGTGTLVHELVHPFMVANFPRCPTWLNEGLASLYECATSRGSRMRGIPNWRLPALKQVIRAGRLASFAALTATTERQFYEEDPGSNYAQARYLLLYLQERGLLKRFWDEVTAATEDPTGYRTLVRVLGSPDMKAFQRQWEAWVLRLRYPQ